jgi:hypothetical protein
LDINSRRLVVLDTKDKGRCHYGTAFINGEFPLAGQTVFIKVAAASEKGTEIKIRLIMLRVLARIHLFILSPKYNIKMGIVEDTESIKDWS